MTFGVQMSQMVEFNHAVSMLRALVPPDEWEEYGEQARRLAVESGSAGWLPATQRMNGMIEMAKRGMSMEEIVAVGENVVPEADQRVYEDVQDSIAGAEAVVRQLWEVLESVEAQSDMSRITGADYTWGDFRKRTEDQMSRIKKNVLAPAYPFLEMVHERMPGEVIAGSGWYEQPVRSFRGIR